MITAFSISFLSSFWRWTNNRLWIAYTCTCSWLNYNCLESWNFNWSCKHKEKISRSLGISLTNSCTELIFPCEWTDITFVAFRPEIRSPWVFFGLRGTRSWLIRSNFFNIIREIWHQSLNFFPHGRPHRS